MTGTEDVDDFIDRITMDDGITLLKSGAILLMIRPIDLQTIVDFYEAETSVLASL